MTSGNGAREEALEDKKADVGAHGFWRQVTNILFFICIVNLESISYLCMMPEKVIVKVEEEKKDRHLQDFLDPRCNFTILV